MCTVNELFLVLVFFKSLNSWSLKWKEKQRQEKSSEIFLALLRKPTYSMRALRTCNAEIQKRSANDSNFKEDDRAWPPL